MATLYPTEATMRSAMSGISYDASREIADTSRMLNTPGAITNPQDRLNAQSYLAMLTSQNPGAAGANVLAANAAYSAPIPGAPDTGDATGGAGANSGSDWLKSDATKKFLETGKTGGPIDDLDVTNPALAWVKEKIGDIGLVVLGVVVVGVALVAASRSNQKMVIEAVKGAALS